MAYIGGMGSKGREVKAIGTIMVKGSTKVSDRVWAMDATCQTWAPALSMAPRLDAAARAQIRSQIETAGLPVYEEE